jgi:class 3 adenylate cyclase
MGQLLSKDLADINSFCNNQYEILQFDKNEKASIEAIEQKGLRELKNSKAIVLGVKPEGRLFFQSSNIKKYEFFQDKNILATINSNLKSKINEGFIYFNFNNEEYFGVYKYSPKWESFIVRAEELNEFYSKSRTIFRNISVVIVIITILSALLGIFVLRQILRFIDIITKAIMKMVKSQQLGYVDMSQATNDDITYLGIAFNSLSGTVDNLISIFKKFANQDIVSKAYRDKEIKLEGSAKELAILFTDIKSFTFITEILGHDIIKLLNLHYDKAIREIINKDGVIGSIIGDALLAVFGAIDEQQNNKSYQAVAAGYKIHEVTEGLRDNMTKVKQELEKEKGKLSKDELDIYKAVQLEVGVGIDGGLVFYGTLGSHVRMTNTVIGDNVNAASRLEGLTRIYKVPIICSEYIKLDIENNVPDHNMSFLELDTVLVKGKTIGKKVFLPMFTNEITSDIAKNIAYYESGLKLYYMGDWALARKHFEKCKLEAADVFLERTKNKCPKNWNGIWEMTTK